MTSLSALRKYTMFRRVSKLKGRLITWPLLSIVRAKPNPSLTILSHPQSHLCYLRIFPLKALFSPLNNLRPVIWNTTHYVLYSYLSLLFPNTDEQEQVSSQRKFHSSLQKADWENLYTDFWHTAGILKTWVSFLLVSSPGRSVMIILKTWNPQLFSRRALPIWPRKKKRHS